MFSALDLVDEYYQLLMRASDIPLTDLSTPSGMLWDFDIKGKKDHEFVSIDIPRRAPSTAFVSFKTSYSSSKEEFNSSISGRMTTTSERQPLFSD